MKRMTSVTSHHQQDQSENLDGIYDGLEELEDLAARFAAGEFDELRSQRMDALLDNMPPGYSIDDEGRLITPDSRIRPA